MSYTARKPENVRTNIISRRAVLRIVVRITLIAAIGWFFWPESQQKQVIRAFRESNLIPEECFNGDQSSGVDFENAPDGAARIEPFGLIASGRFREYVPSGIVQIINKKLLPEIQNVYSLPHLGQTYESFSLVRLDHSTRITLDLIGNCPGSVDLTEITTDQGDEIRVQASRVHLYTSNPNDQLTIKLRPFVHPPKNLLGGFYPLNARIAFDASDLDLSAFAGSLRSRRRAPSNNLEILLRTLAMHYRETRSQQNVELRMKKEQFSKLASGDYFRFITHIHRCLVIRESDKSANELTLEIAGAGIENPLVIQPGATRQLAEQRTLKWLEQNRHALGFDEEAIKQLKAALTGGEINCAPTGS